MAAGIEKPLPRFRAVPGQHHHTDRGLILKDLIQLEKAADEWKGDTRLQRHILMLHLVGPVGRESFPFKQTMFFFEIEQRPGRNSNHQFFILSV